MRKEFIDHSYRRNCLVLFISHRALQYWRDDAISMDCDPKKRECYRAGVPGCVATLKRYAEGDNGALVDISEKCAQMSAAWDYVSPFFTRFLCGFVPLVVMKSELRVTGLDDEIYQSQGWYEEIEKGQWPGCEDDSDGDHFWADAHYWAAILAASIPTGTLLEDDHARAQFWHHWVDYELRFVMGPLEAIQARVSDL
jgi:hypothetical protein